MATCLVPRAVIPLMLVRLSVTGVLAWGAAGCSERMGRHGGGVALYKKKGLKRKEMLYWASVTNGLA